MAHISTDAEDGAQSASQAGSANWRPVPFVVYAILIIGIGWAYALWQMNADRQATLAASNNQLEMTATSLAAQIEAMLNDGVGAAEAGANIVRTTGGTRLGEPAQREVLARMATGGSYVHGLFIVVGDHLVLTPTGDHPLPPRSESGAWVADLIASNARTWIGPPSSRDGDRDNQVAIARRVDDIDGQPSWAGAVIGWETVDDSYARLAVDHSAVAIVTEPGTVLARLPILPQIKYVGVDVDRYEITRLFRALPQRPMVSLTGPDTATGVPRQFVVRRLDAVPVFAVASRNVSDSLRAWRERRVASFQMLGAASLAILALTVALHRLLTRRFEALRHSEERFALAVTGTNDGIWEWEGQTGRLFLAPRLLQLLHRSPRDRANLKPRALRSLVHAEDLPRAEAELFAHLQNRTPLDLELRLRVGNDYRWFRARGQAVWGTDGSVTRMAGAIGDIHDSRLAAQAIEVARRAQLETRKEFARQLILAQEQERKRLANELHDSVGQNLSLMRNRSLLLQRMDLPAPAQRQAEALHGLATDAIEEVRAVAQNLRPLHIEEMGVTDAIEALVERLQHSSPMRVSCKIENIDDVLQGSAATHVYRVVQEAINNALKHADAQHISVTVERDLTVVRLVIADDGRGFDYEAEDRHAGLGLLSLEERAEILGGTFHVESRPGSGTRISIDIPVVEKTAEVEDPAHPDAEQA